jgi:hypothetical protein
MISADSILRRYLRLQVAVWVTLFVCSLSSAADSGVRVLGSPADPYVRQFADWALTEGFQTLWIDADSIGDGRRDRKNWRNTSRELTAAGANLVLVASPAASDRRIGWNEESAYKEFRKRLGKLLRRTTVKAVVFSAHRRSPRLHDLHAAIRFGPESLDAEADWVRRLHTDLSSQVRLWWWPSSSTNTEWGLEDRGRRLRRLLTSLPADIGLVWTGPARLSSSIGRTDLEVARSIAGIRPLALRDGYPMNRDPERLASALVLGPLRNRDADLLQDLEIYVAEPMHQLAASRLPLLTVRTWLSSPGHYDPQTALDSALDRLAGDNDAARRALQTQAAEWGDEIGGRNYKPAWIDTPRQVATRLHDPAFVALWKWTRERYPERIAVLHRLEDVAFAGELTAAMQRRLSLGLAIPQVLAYRSRPDGTGAAALARLCEERARVQGDPQTAEVLQRFLRFAGIPKEIWNGSGCVQETSDAGSSVRNTAPPSGAVSTQISPP